MSKEIIGRREWFSIPELGVDWIRGKIDTGARSSSLHALNIEAFERNDEDWVRFESVDGVRCEAPVVFKKSVRSSNGMLSRRYFIEVTVETLDDRHHVLLVSLSSRAEMKAPLLLGRRALVNFLVDSSCSYCFGKL